MRRLVIALLTSFTLLAAGASAAPPAATIRALDPAKGQVVVFGCQPTAYAKRTGAGASAHFEPAHEGFALRSQTFETIASPVSDSTDGTAYRQVVVPQVLTLGSGWLPERCFHLVVPQETVTCATPIYQDNGPGDGYEMLVETGFTVRRDEIVYPTATLGANADYDHVYTHRPGADGLVPRRCLGPGATAARLARTHATLHFRIVRASAPAPH